MFWLCFNEVSIFHSSEDSEEGGVELIFLIISKPSCRCYFLKEAVPLSSGSTFRDKCDVSLVTFLLFVN